MKHLIYGLIIMGTFAKLENKAFILEPFVSFPVVVNQQKNESLLQREISPDDFKIAFKQWQEHLMLVFGVLEKDYADVLINVVDFRSFIEEQTFVLPINKALQKEWLLLLVRMEKTSTGASLFAQLKENTGACWNLWKNEKSLQKHYQCNKKYYKRLELTAERLATAKLPQKKLFLEALQKSTNPADPALPQNKLVQLQMLQKKASLYEQQLEHWFALEYNTLSKIYSDTSSIVIECSCLNVHSSEVSARLLPEEEKIALLKSLQKACQEKANEQGLLSGTQVKYSTLRILNRYKEQNIKEKNWEKYTLEQLETISFPLNIGRWMLDCAHLSKKNK